MTELKIIYGTRKLEPVRYTVRTEIVAGWFRSYPQYYIESEFMTIGPYTDQREVAEHLRILRY